MNTLKENYEKEVEALKEAHKAEMDQVQAAINEIEIKKIKEETEVNTFLVIFFLLTLLNGFPYLRHSSVLNTRAS